MGKPDFFVCHVYGEPFASLVEALINHQVRLRRRPGGPLTLAWPPAVSGAAG